MNIDANNKSISADALFDERTFSFTHSDSHDYIFNIIKITKSFYEIDLLCGSLPFLSKGDLVVDVGANIGNHTIFWAGVCHCRVIAIEPNPVAYRLLRQNVQANGLGESVRLENIAIGATAGYGKIVPGREHNLGTASIEHIPDSDGAIPIKSIPDVVGDDRVRLLKVDVEGADFDVIVGARPIVERDKPVITIEARLPTEFLKAISILEEIGYRAIGSFNFPPTHIFVHTDDLSDHSTLSWITKNQALDYINGSVLRDQLMRQYGDLSKAIEKVPAQFLSEVSAVSPRIEQLHSDIANIRPLLNTTVKSAASEFLAEIVSLRRTDAAEQALLSGQLEGISAQSEKLDRQLEKIERGITAIFRQVAGMQDKIAYISDETKQLRMDLHRTTARSNERFIKQGRINESLVLLQNIEGSLSSLESLFGGFRMESARRRATESQLPITLQNRKIHNQSNIDALKRTSPPLSVEEIFSETWSRRGWPYAHGRLISGGVVTAVQAGEAGFVTRLFDVDGGGLFEITVETWGEGQSNSRRTVKVISGDNEALSPSFDLSDGPTVLKCFVPSYVRRIKMYVVAQGCSPQDSFSVRRIGVLRLDPERYQRSVREQIGEPVFASLASIPSRKELLMEAVKSLLLQCDRVRVFLNNYEDVPDFLKHPRVDYRRSQDWDDRGDAGKMFWLGRDTVEGYRLIVDDDLIFPPDFAEIMCAKVRSHGKRAVYAVHGILLRQPMSNYYSEKSRAAVFHFSHAMEADQPVHIAATNTACFHSSVVQMHWSEFKHANSADVWLALYCQQQCLPVLTPSRPQGWIRQNRHLNISETIYSHSRTETGSRFDSSLIQDAVLQKSHPLTVQVGNRAKVGALVLIGKHSEALTGRLKQLFDCLPRDSEWIVLLAFNHSDPLACALVDALKVERETHLIDTKDDAAGLEQASSLMKRLSLQAIICLDSESPPPSDREVVAGSGPFIQAIENIGIISLQTRRAGRLDGLLLVANESSIPSDAERMLRAIQSIADTSGGNAFELALQSNKRHTPKNPVRSRQTTINSVFDKVLIVNRNGNCNRSEELQKRLALFEIAAEQFSLSREEIAENEVEFAQYSARTIVSVSDEIRPIRSAADFFENYQSQSARTAYLERGGTKAIRSLDEWNYAKAQKKILENSMRAGLNSVLIMSDDVLVHRDIRDLFAAVRSEIPENWLILQLGAHQYHWDAPSVEWHSPRLYRTNGSSIGAHAVGLRFEIMPFVLDLVARFDMPYDLGALSAARRAFADRCFVAYPNLIVPSFSGSEEKQAKTNEFFRWDLNNYL